MNNDLNQKLLQAHMDGDADTLVALYRRAGEEALATDETQGCFYLTHAYVFALEAGSSVADELHATLKSYGREA